MELGWLDLAVLAVLLISGAFAATRGFIQETLSIFAWAGAAVITLIAFPAFQPAIRQNIQPDLAADAAGLLGIFFLALIPLSYIGYRLWSMAKSTKIDPLDRAAGFVFGAVRGLLVVALAYVGYASVVAPEDYPPWLTEAASYPLVRQSGEVLVAVADAVRGETGGRTVSGRATERSRSDDEMSNDSNEGTAYGPADREALDSLMSSSDPASPPAERKGRQR